MPQKTTKGKPQTQRKPEVKELHVLVHPHFLPFDKFFTFSVYRRKLSDFGAISARNRTNRALKEEWPRIRSRGKSLAGRQEAIDRLYRNAIYKISKKSGAHLVILNLKNVRENPLVKDLIRFARRKLHDRLIVSNSPLMKLPSKLKKEVSLPLHVPIKVFGEWGNLCVSDTRLSFMQAGYMRVYVLRGKTIG